MCYFVNFCKLCQVFRKDTLTWSWDLSHFHNGLNGSLVNNVKCTPLLFYFTDQGTAFPKSHGISSHYQLAWRWLYLQANKRNYWVTFRHLFYWAVNWEPQQPGVTKWSCSCLWVLMERLWLSVWRPSRTQDTSVRQHLPSQKIRYSFFYFQPFSFFSGWFPCRTSRLIRPKADEKLFSKGRKQLKKIPT